MDSKEIKTEKERKVSADWIKKHVDQYWIEPIEVEELNSTANIGVSIRAAWRRCIDRMEGVELILIDGNCFKDGYQKEGVTIPHETVVKGDSKYYSIAAASILAKSVKLIYSHDQLNFIRATTNILKKFSKAILKPKNVTTSARTKDTLNLHIKKG
jgi:ribonuclease HII